MSNLIKTASELMKQETVKAKFESIMGKKAVGFVTSVLNQLNTDTNLSKCDAASVYSCAMVAAILDLPIDKNLGFSYIIPYGQKAQFQLGYKGFIQLAQRSGLFKTISATPIYSGQIASNNPLTGFEFDFSIESKEVVGYAAYFELLNGFSKTLYMTKKQVEDHGRKYSKAYSNMWTKDFDAMAIKTVIKQLLSKYAPLSIEMQKAVIFDNSTPKNPEQSNESEYEDLSQQIEIPENITLKKVAENENN